MTKIQELEKEKQEIINDYTEREEQFKQQTEKIVKKLKESSKKEKEKVQ